MFWLARLIRLVRPMPPTPTAATLSVSLGGVNPRPRTFLGIMAQAAPPAATSVRKVRREIAFFLLMSKFSESALSRGRGGFAKASFGIRRTAVEPSGRPPFGGTRCNLLLDFGWPIILGNC